MLSLKQFIENKKLVENNQDALWEKIDKQLSKVSGYDRQANPTSNIKNIQFLNLVQCLDKEAKKTLPKSTNYTFDIRTRTYTELKETKNDKSSQSSQSSQSSSSGDYPTMNLIPVKTLDGVDLDVNPEFLEALEKAAGYLLTGALSNEELGKVPLCESIHCLSNAKSKFRHNLPLIGCSIELKLSTLPRALNPTFFTSL